MLRGRPAPAEQGLKSERTGKVYSRVAPCMVPISLALLAEAQALLQVQKSFRNKQNAKRGLRPYQPGNKQRYGTILLLRWAAVADERKLARFKADPSLQGLCAAPY